MDVSGTTLAGNVVRTLNGQTGDVITSLVGVGLPGNIANGNILVYSPNGSTLVAYDLFTGGTFDANNSFRFGSSGGMQIGTGGIKYGSSNSLKGNVQIFGATGTQVSFHDASFDPTNESESGGHLFFGRIGRDSNDPMGLVYTGGRTEGFESNANAPYFVVQHSDRKIGLLGITNPNSPIDYKSRNQTSVKDVDIRITDSNGVTSGVRVFQNSFSKDNEGLITESKPNQKGLRTKKSIRVIPNDQNVAVDLDFVSASEHTNFSIFGKENAGASLSPVLNARNTGDVVIGGITASDAGSSYGSLNVVSGKLLVGGTLGQQTGNGVQVLASNGISSGYKTIFPSEILTEDVDLDEEYSLIEFQSSGFGSGSNTIMVGPADARRQYLGAGGDGMVTNKTIQQSITGFDIATFVRHANIQHGGGTDFSGVTYAPLAESLDGGNASMNVQYSNANITNPTLSNLYGRFITGRSGNPYDRVICLKDENNNNLVGDFELSFTFPVADVDDGGERQGHRQRSNIMGVAVFVDMDDDVLAELKLGSSAAELDPLTSTGFYGTGSLSGPTIANPVCRDGSDGHFVGSPDGNLLRFDLGVQFAQPFGIFGPLDPAVNSFAQISFGGPEHDGLLHKQTFTFSGTARRRVQILPFNTLYPTQSNIFDGTDQVASIGFNPFGGGFANTNTGIKGYIHKGGGVLNATFKQLEV